MNWLAVDTSGNHLSIIISKDKVLFKSFISNVCLKHSITLLPELESLLEKANLTLNDIDVFACVVGPGSFTGIRIGVSTVKALAYSLNKKVLKVTSFETLAYNEDSKRVLAVIDAKHDNYYACGFVDNEVLIQPCFINKEQLLTLSKDYVVVSDCEIGDFKNVGSVEKGLIKAVNKNLCLATFDREVLIPLYVKKSQAEEELK